MMISSPPKYSVSPVVGFIKGKNAIHLARTFGEQMQNHVRKSSGCKNISCQWLVAMRPRFGIIATHKYSDWVALLVGRDEATIRDYSHT